jgi:alkylation response protein AidB-like acyl-CoA dehydrogenase
VKLRYSEADESFRAELRAWLEGALPALPAPAARDAWTERRAWDTDWQKRLFDAATPTALARRLRRTGRLADRAAHLLRGDARQRAPYVGVNFVGTLHAGPTLIEEGSDAQKADHLPRSCAARRSGARVSPSPGAGSDLASLRTRAELDGDHYVLNGPEDLVLVRQVADVGEFLVRTDPDAPKHRGISWLILAMDSPGSKCDHCAPRSVRRSSPRCSSPTCAYR